MKLTTSVRKVIRTAVFGDFDHSMAYAVQVRTVPICTFN